MLPWTAGTSMQRWRARARQPGQNTCDSHLLLVVHLVLELLSAHDVRNQHLFFISLGFEFSLIALCCIQEEEAHNAMYQTKNQPR